jgi:hypothetical protein
MFLALVFVLGCKFYFSSKDVERGAIENFVFQENKNPIDAGKSGTILFFEDSKDSWESIEDRFKVKPLILSDFNPNNVGEKSFFLVDFWSNKKTIIVLKSIPIYLLFENIRC